MEIAVLVAFVVAIVGLLVSARLEYRKGLQTWQKVAERFELECDHHHMEGRYREVDVRVFTETRGPRKTPTTYTLFRAELDEGHVPPNLHISREGTVDEPVRAQDVELGIPDLDARLVINGSDADEIRRWASRGDVARALEDIIALEETLYVDTKCVVLETSEIMRDETEMIRRIETIVTAARALSGKGYGALRYDESW